MSINQAPQGSTLNKLRTRLGILGRLGITLLILAYLGHQLNWTVLRGQFIQSDPILLFVACFLAGASIVVAAVRWWLLLKIQRINLPIHVVGALTFIGQFFNSFLLGSTGGDVIKILYLLKYAPSQKTHSTLSIIIDRAMGLLILLCIVVAVLPWQIHILTQSREMEILGYILWAVLGVAIGAVAIIAISPFDRLPHSLHRLWQKIPKRHVIELVIYGLRQHGHFWCLTLVALSCSLAIWFLVFTAGYCIALSMHLNVTYMQILVVLALVTCIISLPISIGGHGIREGAFVLMFTVFDIVTIDKHSGIGQEPAVLFSILFLIVFSVWSLIGGLVYLTFEHAYRKDKHFPA